MSEAFAPPLNKLGDSGIGVAAAPTGGMGFALTPDGKLPAAVLFLDSTRRIAVGSATLTWPGAAPATTVSITHGFNVGNAPYIVATSTITNGGFAVAAYVNAVTATTATLGGYAQGGNPPAGNTATVYWIAIV